MSYDLKIKNGDLVLDNSGSLTTVVGNQKIRQDIVKILLTRLGENKFHPNYGSDIGSLRIGDALSKNMVESDMKRSVEQALRYLISLQKTQSRFQFLSSSEVILDIQNVGVERDSGDPRLYNIFISVLTQKLDVLEEVITIRIV